MPGPLGRLALLLPGGGSAGLQQCGQILGFLDSGLQYDMLLGASVGALNGCLLHQGDIEQMHQMWLSVQSADVWRLTPSSLLRAFTDRASIYSPAPLRQKILQMVNPVSIRERVEPFFISTTDLTSGRAWLVNSHGSEDIHEVLMGSCSVPVFFPPVTYGKRRLIDGGVLNNFCVSEAVRQGADTLVVLLPRRDTNLVIRNVLDMVSALLSLMMRSVLYRDLEFTEMLNSVPSYRDVRVVVIEPTENVTTRLLDFNLGSRGEREQAIERERKNTAEILRKVH